MLFVAGLAIGELVEFFKVFNNPSQLVKEDIIEQRFGTVGQVRMRDTNAVQRNFNYTLDTTGVYTSIENQISDNLNWTFGLRADHLDGDFTAFGSDGVNTNSDIYDFGWIVQPKFNIFYQATDAAALFFNIGESFQHPFGASLYSTGNTSARDVSTNVGWEIGSKLNFLENLDVRISAWQQTAQDEFIVVDGATQNVGKTMRKGWELALNFAPFDMLDIWANYSSVDTEIVNTSSASASTAGNELRSIPEYTASVGFDLSISDAMTARLHVDAQGDYFVNEANLGGQFGNYTLTHASIDRRFKWGSVSLNANNILDKYYEYVFDFSADGTETIHSPGDGRNFSLSVAITL